MINAKKIIEYENRKKEFYRKRNERIEPVITEAYCEYEEMFYGDSLMDIYRGLNKIREGKEYLKKHLKVLSILFLTTILISLTKYFFVEKIPFMLLMTPIGISVATLGNIKKYWLYLTYEYCKRNI